MKAVRAGRKMDPTPVPGSLVVLDWHRCADSKEHFSRIQRRNVRKRFGLLEAPVLRPLLAADTVSYKIFLSGKSGVGKTALAARLGGLPVPSMHHETTGVQTTVVFWPVKLRENGRVLFFRLQLWDCGENTLRRFDHLLPACTEQADAVLLLFSFTDRTSFDDLSSHLTRSSSPSASTVRLVVGTKFDLFMHTDVTERELREFQQVWGVPVFRVPGGAGAAGAAGAAGLADVAPLLDALAEHLWHRDVLAARSPEPEPARVRDSGRE